MRVTATPGNINVILGNCSIIVQLHILSPSVKLHVVFGRNADIKADVRVGFI